MNCETYKNVIAKDRPAINNKGWNIYLRGKLSAKSDVEEMYKRKPVESLEKSVVYVVMPRTEKYEYQEALNVYLENGQIQPKIILPFHGFARYGRRIVILSGEYENQILLRPGEEISFFIFELQETEISIIFLEKLFLPYNVFEEALKTLQSIGGLTANAK